MVKLIAVTPPELCGKAVGSGFPVMATGWSANEGDILRPKNDIRCDIICVTVNDCTSLLAGTIVSECRRVGARGVFLDYKNGLEEKLTEAASGLRAYGYEVYTSGELPVPGTIPTDGEIMSPQKTPRAVFLKIRRSRTVMFNTGVADKHDITQAELSSMLDTHNIKASFSSELNANYFTLKDKDKSFFVVFDDKNSVRARLELAERKGYKACFMLYPDITIYRS